MLTRSILRARWLRLFWLIAVPMLSGCVNQSGLAVSPLVTPSILKSTSAVSVTSVPTSTAVPCEYDAQFIQDLSVPDGSHMLPGTTFTKIWAVRNGGTCTWTNGYQLKFIGGSHLHESILTLTQTIKPSDTLTISLPLAAPDTAGNYRGRWRLFAADGTPFGQTLFVEIVVP